MSLRPQFPAKVCETRCASCIFGPNSPLRRTRFAELAKRWAKMRGGHQSCHQYGTTEGGEDVCCRGFWDTQVTDEVREACVAAEWVVFVPAAPSDSRVSMDSNVREIATTTKEKSDA